MKSSYLVNFQQRGLYGFIDEFIEHADTENKPRVTAFNLLKEAKAVAKKGADERLEQLAPIAFDISHHESVYRAAAFLYITLGKKEKALECYSYLVHYYNKQKIEPHKQMVLIQEELSKMYGDINLVEKKVSDLYSDFLYQNDYNNIKEFSEALPVKDAQEQAVYFTKIYLYYGKSAVAVSITSDLRFNNRQKAVLLIRASRAVAAISEEGSSAESYFADKALALDTSETVVNNCYKAYLRAGDLNKITKLKEAYSFLVA